MDTGDGGQDGVGARADERTDGVRLSRRHVLAGLCGAAGLTMVPAMGRFLLPAATAAGVVSVTLELDQVAGQRPERSMGFSFEKNTLSTPLFSATNAPLVALFRLLGPGVLRLGGNSVDRVTFDADGPGSTAGVVAPPDLTRLAAFADAVDWQIVYGTPFLFSTAAQVRDEAVAATAALGARIDAFELCNEPDLYVLDATAKPIAGTPALFNARWQSFADEIRTALPDAVLCGPSTCFITFAKGFTNAFATTHAGSFSLLTQHYYRGFGFGSQTIDLLLGPDPDLDAGLDALRATATAGGTTYRLAETNSFANGGQPGVSNTFASALWGADLCFKAAENGAAGLNFHNSGAGLGYPAIVTVNGVVTQIRPLFYGLLLATAAGAGPMPPIQVTGAESTLRVHAVQPSSTSVRAVLINTGAEAATIDLDVGREVTAATVARLLGPSLAATADVTLAGATVGIDGSWTPAPAEVAPVTGTRVTLAVPAASALVVTVTVVAAPPVTTTTSSTTTSSTTTSSTTTTPPNPTSTSTTSPTSSTTADPGSPAIAPAAASPAQAVPVAPAFTG